MLPKLIMDGISLAAMRYELAEKLINSKVEKIYQPGKEELIINFRGNQKLLLNVSANNCRAQLTGIKLENPAQPPTFCMLLRKHLGSARILEISQPNFDRILKIAFSAQDELGENCIFYLITEIMGKHSNIILTRENGQIIDAIKHITPLISSVRSVMPGLMYQLPPSQNKLNPLNASEADISALLSEKTGALDKFIFSSFSGVCPSYSKEIAQLCLSVPCQIEDMTSIKKELCSQRIAEFFVSLKNGNIMPTIAINQFDEAIACFPFDTIQYEPAFKKHFESLSLALDSFYSMRDTRDRIKQRGAAMRKMLSNNIERLYKKISQQNDILSSGDQREQWRLYGELLTANAYRLERGLSAALVENYYEADMAQISIPMDASFSPSENAKRYFKKYNKAKAAFDMANEQIEQINFELDYLEGQLNNLDKCTLESELNEIREELTAQGYIKRQSGKKAIKNPPTKPLHFKTADGAHIYVGKNNVQNEYLTMRLAKSEDIWLHTKNIPGSHVIIKADEAPSDNDITIAAQIAAYYSKAKNGVQVPVDYTQKKNVKKPSGSRPGYVIYLTNKTAYVTPDESIIKQLLQA